MHLILFKLNIFQTVPSCLTKAYAIAHTPQSATPCFCGRFGTCTWICGSTTSPSSTLKIISLYMVASWHCKEVESFPENMLSYYLFWRWWSFNRCKLYFLARPTIIHKTQLEPLDPHGFYKDRARVVPSCLLIRRASLNSTLVLVIQLYSQTWNDCVWHLLGSSFLCHYSHSLTLSYTQSTVLLSRGLVHLSSVLQITRVGRCCLLLIS